MLLYNCKEIISFLFCFFFIVYMIGCAELDTGSSSKDTMPMALEQSNATSEDTTELQAEDYLLHTVKWNGESISIIAEWYTGDLQNWEMLAKHNPHLDPNKIYIGDTVQIPKKHLITTKPMTKEFVQSFYPEQQVPENEPKPETNEEEPELFGPKPFKDQ